jgi:phage gpG-like protein
MTEEIVIGKEALVRKFKGLSDVAQGSTLANTVRVGGLVILNAARDNIKKQGLIQTRTLSRSLHEEVTMQGKHVAVDEIGTDLEYAAIHEFGGVIHPRTAKYLAIPVGDYTGSPSKYPGLKLRKTKNGNLVLVSASGQVQYVLKSSVEIPARPYLRPALDEHQEEALQEMGEAFATLVTKAAEA